MINVQYRKYDDKMALAIVVTTMMKGEREKFWGLLLSCTPGAATHSQSLAALTKIMMVVRRSRRRRTMIYTFHRIRGFCHKIHTNKTSLSAL